MNCLLYCGKKVKPSLSAGRVQSVAVRLIVEREREIQNFKYQSSFRVVANFLVGNNVVLKAELPKRFKTEQEAEQFLTKCKNAEFKVDSLETKPSKKSPEAPFTTSTLQQEASRKLGYSVSQTMSVAQKLYESGKITYMRTDSVNSSDDHTSWHKFLLAQLSMPVGAIAAVWFVLVMTSSELRNLGGPVDVIVFLGIAAAGAVGAAILVYTVQSLLFAGRLPIIGNARMPGRRKCRGAARGSGQMQASGRGVQLVVSGAVQSADPFIQRPHT